MSYFNKWLRGSQPAVKPRNRSQSLDVQALERSGIRLVSQLQQQQTIYSNVRVFFVVVI